ncbi:MAG TPA: M48 family metallopeptidase [Bacteroidales bacterium]|nr:M48 family metallopeptidase [Bacteroidales bacterium]HOU97213.1 M48 family metallopeptidase [Bacteroidales bacterium]
MKTKIFLFFSILFLLIRCYKVPITNRNQIRLMPDIMITNLALTSYQDFMSKNKIIPSSDNRSKQLDNVGNRMVAAVNNLFANTKYKDRIKNQKWEYHLVDNPTVNAWCMPGGKIVFYSGILPYTQDDEGIAVVMGHEMAHAIAKHGNERMSQQMAIMMGGVTIDVAMQQRPEETKEIFKSLYGVSATLGALAYSRKHEYEADKIGLVIMAKAGYNPEKAIAFWERMSQKSGGSIPQFLSTHPSDENRIKEMKKFLPTAMKYYKTN